MNKTNNIYLYNNTFINLLTLITFLINKHIIPSNIKSEEYQPSLIDEIINLELEDNTNIIRQIINKLGLNVFNIIYTIYLSNDENKELIIFFFILSSLKYQKNVIYMHNLKYVNEALKIAHYVKRESHKMKGFIRFKELKNNILYAEFSPENNVIFLIVNHFKQRLNNEYWIIKDIKRNIICIYDKKDINFFYDVDLNLNSLSSNEILIEELWKNFYKTIGIKERKNSRCRMNFMPKKYWKYIIEMSDEIETSC